MTEWLIKHNASVDVVDKKHNSPLQTAIMNKAMDAAMVLIENKANLNETNSQGETALHMIKDYFSKFSMISFSNFKYEFINLIGSTFSENQENRKKIAKALIKNGINHQHRDNKGKTAADYFDKKPGK